MEDFKTSFTELLERFVEPSVNVQPKKLMFDCLNNSRESPVPVSKKRKLSLDPNDSAGSKQLNNTPDNTNSQDSLNTSMVSSPWEARRMKADLVEAKSRIIKLKQEIEQQHTLRASMELMYNNKVSALQKQCDFTSQKVLDMEKHLTAIRKRENASKTELVKLKNQIVEQKQIYDEKLFDLQRANSEIEESSRTLQNKLANELGESRRTCERLQLRLDMEQEQVENLTVLNESMQERVSLFEQMKSELEAEKHLHEISKSKIKQMEYEIASFGEWKEMSKGVQNRLSTMPDLEKEVNRLRQENRNLRDSLGNKLLLEEQVYDLKTRLEKSEELNADKISLQVQIDTIEKELKEWKRLAEDHCPPNSGANPSSLRSRIEHLLQKDIIQASEKATKKSEKDMYKGQIQELQTQNDIKTKTISDLTTTLKHHKNVILRVQKKLVLVAKERDCFKQLLENFDKDLTISGTFLDALNPDAQLKARLEMLEKTLSGYKEMNANLERELSSLKNLPDIPMEIPINTDSYDRLKKDIASLRIENERLKCRKQELELEMEHRCLKGDFNVDKYKVIHMAANPADEAYENSKNEMEKLQAEIERLKRKIRQLEEDNEEMTTRVNDTANMTINIRELNVLRSKLEATEAKLQHMKEVFKSTTMEFREVCYMLFGYRVDRVANTNYRISSMYAESENEYLNFRLSESGILDMLETEYSASLADMMQTQLSTHRSLPAFLSSLTLELFNRVTVVS